MHLSVNAPTANALHNVILPSKYMLRVIAVYNTYHCMCCVNNTARLPVRQSPPDTPSLPLPLPPVRPPTTPL